MVYQLPASDRSIVDDGTASRPPTFITLFGPDDLRVDAARFDGYGRDLLPVDPPMHTVTTDRGRR